jgi:hypothetical protein
MSEHDVRHSQSEATTAPTADDPPPASPTRPSTAAGRIVKSTKRVTRSVIDWRPVRPWLRWIAVAVVYLGTVGYLFGTGMHEHSERLATPAAEDANKANNKCPTGSPPTGTQKPARLVPQGTQVQSIAFGRGLTKQTRDFEFGLTDPSGLLSTAPAAKGATCLPVQVGGFLRTGQVETAELNPEQIGATALIKGQQVLVRVILERRDPGFGPSGTYTGTISIVDPRTERVDIPLAVTLAYPVWRLPLVVLLLVLPVSVAYLWLLRGSFRAAVGQAGKTVTFAEFDEYIFSRNGLLAIGAGAGSAILVFSATYLRSPTWGGDFVEAIGLFGAMFAGFAAASSPVTAAGQEKPKDPSG